MDLIWQFEYEDSFWGKCFLHVLNKFEHHYTKEPIYYVRVDAVGPVTRCGHIEFKTLDQKEFSELYAKRITGNDT